MRRLKPGLVLMCLLLLGCILVNFGVAGCSQQSASPTTPIENPPTPPGESGAKALDSGLMGGGAEYQS
jgi:hypothetical protein